MTYLTDCNGMKKPYQDRKENHHPTTPSLFKQTATNILKIKNSILFTILFVAFAGACFGADVVGDFQSKTNGNWNINTSWKICSVAGNPGTFIDADLGQIPVSSKAVTILNGHTITSDAAGCLTGNLTINTGGTLICSGASELTVNGNFFNAGVFTTTGGTFIMAGTKSTTITNTGSPIVFNELIIKNTSSAGGVTSKTSFTVTQNMTIYNECYFSASNDEIFTINGNFTNNGFYTFNYSTVIMSGSSAKNISGTAIPAVFAFYNLSIENTGGILSANSFRVYGNMTIKTSCSFSLGSSNIIQGNGTGLSHLSGSGIVYVTGSIDPMDGDYVGQYPNFIRTIDHVEYIGNSKQVISAIPYVALKINNIKGCTIKNDVTCETLEVLSGVLTVAPTGTLVVTSFTNLQYIAPDPTGEHLQKRFESCLVLQSNASSTGSFKFSYNADSTPNIIGPGNMRVERYMSIDDHWHLYCSPMKNQSLHDFLKYNPEIPNLYNSSNVDIGIVSMQEYDTENDQWKLYPIPNYPLNSYFVYNNTSTNQSSMSEGKGFSVSTIPDDTGTGTIEATGIPNDKSVNITIDGRNKGWNCIGNPYTCAIVVSTFLAGNTDLTNEVPFQYPYLWDETIPEYSSEYNYIQSGQAFFIKSKPVAGIAHFTNDMQILAKSIPFKEATTDWPSIRLVAQFQTLKSTTKIKFVTNTTKGLDPGYDAGMLKANKDFALYSRLIEDIGVDFCLQSLPDQNFDQYVIPIGIDFKVGGDITFIAETINLPSGCQALLEDRLTKKFTRLDLKDAKYTTTVSANTKGTGRFFLHTSDVISSVQPIEKESFKVNTVGTTLYINGQVSDKANFFIYSVNGKQLANFKAESQVQNQFDASGFPAGVYILTCDDLNQKKSTKFVIEN